MHRPGQTRAPKLAAPAKLGRCDSPGCAGAKPVSKWTARPVREHCRAMDMEPMEDTMHTQNTMTATAPSTFLEYLQGQTVYMAMRPLDACANVDQRRGWMAALWHGAQADAPACTDSHELDEIYAEMHATAIGLVIDTAWNQAEPMEF